MSVGDVDAGVDVAGVVVAGGVVDVDVDVDDVEAVGVGVVMMDGSVDVNEKEEMMA